MILSIIKEFENEQLWRRFVIAMLSNLSFTSKIQVYPQKYATSITFLLISVLAKCMVRKTLRISRPSDWLPGQPHKVDFCSEVK